MIFTLLQRLINFFSHFSRASVAERSERGRIDAIFRPESKDFFKTDIHIPYPGRYTGWAPLTANDPCASTKIEEQPEVFSNDGYPVFQPESFSFDDSQTIFQPEVFSSEDSFSAVRPEDDFWSEDFDDSFGLNAAVFEDYDTEIVAESYDEDPFSYEEDCAM